MKPKRAESDRRDEDGFVMVMAAFLIAALIGIGALVFDLGWAWVQKRQMQIAADSGSLSGVWQLQQGPNALVTNAVSALVLANESSPGSEITSVECIDLNPTTRQFAVCNAGNASCLDCQSPRANAVRVLTRRTVPSIFGKLFGITALNTPAESIAQAQFPNSPNCIRPFGIEAAGEEDSPLDDVEVGDIFTVYTRNNAPGNWGKLDIGGNMSAGPNFRNAMLNSICHGDAAVGEVVSQATGNSNPIEDVFDDLLSAGMANNLYMPKVTNFQNGNSSVTILGYILVDYLGEPTACGRGRNWCANFRLVADNVDPPVGGGTGIPDRAHLVR